MAQICFSRRNESRLNEMSLAIILHTYHNIHAYTHKTISPYFSRSFSLVGHQLAWSDSVAAQQRIQGKLIVYGRMVIVFSAQ